MPEINETIVENQAMTVRKKRHGLYSWLGAKTQEVLDFFGSMKDAQKIGSGDDQFVFIPGTRDDRVLLVAHADTVFDKREEKEVRPIINYANGKFFSGTNDMGIGADDRAGCAIVYQLRDLGHSILIPNGEESGCVGSRFLANHNKDLYKIINEHRFAIEFDRRGNDDLIFYDVGSNKFVEWCESNFIGYTKGHGSFTDICVLCDPMCGLNISVGYYDQHMPTEHLIESEWTKTLETARKVLSQKNLPRFIQDPPPIKSYKHSESYRTFSTPTQEPFYGATRISKPRLDHKVEDIVLCFHCDAIMDPAEKDNNNNLCIYCFKEF